MKHLAWLVLAALLSACGGEPLVTRAPRAQQVIDLGQQGQAAYFKGDLARAARLFEQALAAAQRIEDSEGVVLMSLDLARVTREAGDSAGAWQRLAAIAPWHRAGIGAATARQLDLQSAVLLSDLQRRDEALALLRSLRERCRAACELAIGIDSLEARLRLENGDAQGAAQLATTALAIFGGHGKRLEVANLLRVAGEAQLALGDFAAAVRELESALAIDKSLAQPGKIALDLEVLTRAALAAGDSAAHAGYRARLEEVRQTQAGLQSAR